MAPFPLPSLIYVINSPSQLEVILCARALNLGRSWWTVASQIATLANFYLTTWEEYHTGAFIPNYVVSPPRPTLLL